MKINWQRAILSGLIGTVAFDISGIIGIILLGAPFWPEPRLLAEKLELATWQLGLLGHYGNGVLLAVIFAAAAPSLWGPAWVRGLTFFTLETVFGIWMFMLPLLGLGPLGLKMGALFPLVILVRHWILGVVVATVNPVGTENDKPAVEPARASAAGRA